MLKSQIARFVVTVLAWLPVVFVIWYFAAPLLLWPVKLLAEAAVGIGAGDLVRLVEQQGSIATFTTTLKPGTATAAGGVITVDVNMRLYSFGMPLFAALVLAAREPGWPRRLVFGCVALMPFVAWGVVADFLKSIAITSGPMVASQTGFVAWQREAIAFAYQFGSLILPTVVPAIAWVVSHRRFLERLRRES
jgi:hypothetical protein